jgi:arginine deiminase
VIHPAAALFEKGFDPEDAARDHKGYVQMLEARGVRVVLLKDLLTSKAASDAEWLSRLRNLAKACVSLDLTSIPEVDHAVHRETVLSSIDALSPKLLVDTIVNRPRIHPSETAINTKFEARYEIQPEMNLFFCRDQIITTAKGPVLAHMNSTQRVSEVRLVKLALEAMGTPPIFAVTGEGRLEGGDFIPAGDWAFQGQGLRTNEAAVKQLLGANVYGCRYVCVVKDSWQDQEEMHLDTFFNIAGREVCTLVETRFRAERGTQQYLKCDVYEWVRGTYHLRARNLGFVDVLHQAGFKHIISVPKADQLIYGCNYLCMGDKDIILVKRERGVSEAFKRQLIDAGVRFVECEMSSLTKGYGAAHCTTQVCRAPFEGSN